MCQNIETYHTAPANLKFDTIEEFEEKIERILRKKNKYSQNIYKLREIGQKRILELDHNIGAHLEALNTSYGSSEREFLREWN